VGLGELAMSAAGSTPWEHGRFDAREGPSKVLFGRMYEDAAIELQAFRPGGRIFCIASAGCTAMKLASRHEVVAVDINPDQLRYAAQRIAGMPAVRGTAERVMAFGRTFAPLVGWSSRRVEAFLDLDDPVEQLAFWHQHLDTRRFRFAFGALFSTTALGAIYASPFLGFLPRRLGSVMRSRLERCFARHPNRTNPYARALLLGELADDPPPREASAIELRQADAAEWLEHQPAASFDGFTLSNILDGADEAYRQRTFAAVKRAAKPEAVVVLRSFGEPPQDFGDNRAAEDRSMLWGIVAVCGAATLAGIEARAATGN
jgi:S-adenosylmethionine:diacylglycerol 3-amino-3-carboxypropyl transferase